MALKKAKQINGTPLHYARTLAHPYGTRGVQVTFGMKKGLHKSLEACFTELFKACPLGKPEVITSAGAFVNKPGAHGRGDAIDIDGLFWKDYTLITKSFPVNVELYLGIESYLRRHFGIVLNYEYNAAHEDHWHIDNSIGTGFSKRSRSKVLYLQLTLKHIYQLNVIVDGLYGPQTENAYKSVAKRLELPSGMAKVIWLKYLELTGQVAFALFEEKNSPRSLFASIYELVNEQPANQSRGLIEALNDFNEHPDTVAWMGKMKSAEEVLTGAIAGVLI